MVRDRRIRSGPTLVESLVIPLVLVVIAVLLIPVRRGARENVRWVGCAHHLRILGLAASMYAGDHGDYPCWHPHRTVAHTDGNDVGCFTYNWYELWTPYTERMHVFHDPSLEPLRLKGRAAPHYYTAHGCTADRRDTYYCDYSWNQEALFAREPKGGLRRIKTTDVAFPATTIGLLCKRGTWKSWTFAANLKPDRRPTNTGLYSTSLDGGPNLAHRTDTERYLYAHKGCMNVLFVDGHVTRYKPDIPGRDWFTASARRHWCRSRGDLE